MSIRTINQLAARVTQDSQLAADIKNDPAGTLNLIAAQAQIPDTLVYRIVVAALGISVLIALIGAIIIVLQDKTNLEVPTAIGSAAVGALAGLLAPSPAAN